MTRTQILARRILAELRAVAATAAALGAPAIADALAPAMTTAEALAAPRRRRGEVPVEPWLDALGAHLAGRTGRVTLVELLGAVGLERGRATHGDLMRLGECLRGLGWARKRVRGQDGARGYVYEAARP